VRRIAPIIISFCLLFGLIADAHGYARPQTASVRNTSIPNVFRPFKRIIRRVFGSPVSACTWSPKPALLTGLYLDRHEMVVGHGEESDPGINISTSIENPDYNLVAFVYKVTAGKIVGAGAKVKWDLSGVEPGVYTITAGVNDGSGVLATKTVKVETLQCAGCTLRETE